MPPADPTRETSISTKPTSPCLVFFPGKHLSQPWLSQKSRYQTAQRRRGRKKLLALIRQTSWLFRLDQNAQYLLARRAGGFSDSEASYTDSSRASDDGGDVAATSSSAPNAPPNTPSMSTVALSVATTPSAAVSLSPSLASTPAPAPTDGSSDARATPAFSSGSASHGFSTSSCTTQGQSICSPDGLQIGICTMESTVTWRAWIPMAAGTKCAGGYMVGAKGRRSAKFLSDYFFWRAAPRLQASL